MSKGRGGGMSTEGQLSSLNKVNWTTRAKFTSDIAFEKLRIFTYIGLNLFNKFIISGGGSCIGGGSDSCIGGGGDGGAGGGGDGGGDGGGALTGRWMSPSSLRMRRVCSIYSRCRRRFCRVNNCSLRCSRMF